MMGSNDGESNEQPVHKVYLDAFYMDKYDVTVEQYRKFIEATGHREPENWSEQWQNPRRPVVNVSWDDAVAYTKWAGKRLPTEAEWEKAARGGLVGKKYPWGNSIDSSKANYDVNNTRNYSWDNAKRYLQDVGSYPPNGYGLYDMAGNVWNWVADWYGKDYYETSPYKNPKGPDSGDYRVLRGGSWGNYAGSIRAANRYWDFPVYWFNFDGFRCARTP